MELWSNLEFIGSQGGLDTSLVFLLGLKSKYDILTSLNVSELTNLNKQYEICSLMQFDDSKLVRRDELTFIDAIQLGYKSLPLGI